ncbi:anti-sigma factor [Agrococcus sp. DT81.2]|uniref:anti-sigma factor n=1 Tax=Agrococcus sp. DT81.2 TaxID=3393414 RepID=UPI003CE54010
MSDDQRSIDDLAAAYALDALSPAERARFEAEASPAARAEAAELADTAALLAGDPAAPPPSLRASVLDAIAREPQLPAVAPAAAPTPLAAPAVPAAVEPVSVEPRGADGLGTDGYGGAPRHASTGPGPAERRANARWRPLRTLGAIAASAALLLGGVALGSQLGGDSRQEALGAVVSAADAERSEVALPDGSTATVIWSTERGQSAILFDGLSAPPEGSTYQAWYIDEDGPQSAGTFEASGGATAFLLDGALTAGSAVGVTVEPEGGSDAPTTDPILVVET